MTNDNISSRISPLNAILRSMMKTLTEITLDHTSVITIKLIKIKLVIYPKFRLRRQLLINNNIKTLLDRGMVFKV